MNKVGVVTQDFEKPISKTNVRQFSDDNNDYFQKGIILLKRKLSKWKSY